MAAGMSSVVTNRCGEPPLHFACANLHREAARVLSRDPLALLARNCYQQTAFDVILQARGPRVEPSLNSSCCSLDGDNDIAHDDDSSVDSALSNSSASPHVVAEVGADDDDDDDDDLVTPFERFSAKQRGAFASFFERLARKRLGKGHPLLRRHFGFDDTDSADTSCHRLQLCSDLHVEFHPDSYAQYQVEL